MVLGLSHEASDVPNARVIKHASPKQENVAVAVRREFALLDHNIDWHYRRVFDQRFGVDDGSEEIKGSIRQVAQRAELG